MPDPEVSRLDKLHALEEWLDWQLRQTRARIRELEAQERQGQGQGRREQGSRAVDERRERGTPRPEGQQSPTPRPRTPEWGITDGARTPHEVHRGDCWAMGRQLRPVSREEAVTALVDGATPCDVCRPDRVLGAP
ncbi:DUF6233 domain-containing protein [Streptomyces sp. NPDC052052]|uniref:DUF6233 domain-containing protein n=1 Tax=Streptomyces sp. NPDC052052 TaxID=3154756 RepID=UPI00342ABD8B